MESIAWTLRPLSDREQHRHREEHRDRGRESAK